MARTPAWSPSAGGGGASSPYAARIDITAIGMVASLGLDVATNCAAARARIVRSREMDDFPVRNLVDGTESGLVVHAAPEITRGFEGFARLLRLTQAGLVDLRRAHDDAFWNETPAGFYLSLPHPLRIYEGLALLADESDRTERARRAKEAEKAWDPALPEELLRRAARFAGWSKAPLLKFVALSGRTGFFEAIERAAQDLASEQIDTAIVGGIDSLIDADVIEWLGETQRLKTLNVAVGLQPGEGAAFLSLETDSKARRRNARALGRVEAVQIARESRPWASGQSPMGDGLTEAISAIATGQDERPWLLMDHAGEAYSAMEWGMALVRLRARHAAYAAPTVSYPAASFGDTGAAAGAIATCMVLRAFERKYAPSRSALVTTAADGPLRAVAKIASAEPGRQA